MGCRQGEEATYLSVPTLGIPVRSGSPGQIARDSRYEYVPGLNVPVSAGCGCRLGCEESDYTLSVHMALRVKDMVATHAKSPPRYVSRRSGTWLLPP